MKKISKSKINSQLKQAQRKAVREVKFEMRKFERDLNRKLK